MILVTNKEGTVGVPTIARTLSEGGSASIPVQISSLQREHPSANQFNAGATMHGALERLQSVDLTLRLPITPGFEDGITNRLDVLPQYPDKASRAVNAPCAGVVQPDASRSTVPPRSKPRKRIANARIVVKSADAALSASTLMICRAVIWLRGFTQSAAAVNGEI